MTEGDGVQGMTFGVRLGDREMEKSSEKGEQVEVCEKSVRGQLTESGMCDWLLGYNDLIVLT